MFRRGRSPRVLEIVQPRDRILRLAKYPEVLSWFPLNKSGSDHRKTEQSCPALLREVERDSYKLNCSPGW